MIIQTKSIYTHEGNVLNNNFALDINGIHSIEELRNGNSKVLMYGGDSRELQIPYPELFNVWKENKQNGVWNDGARPEKVEPKPNPEIQYTGNHKFSMEFMNNEFSGNRYEYILLNTNFLCTTELKESITDCTGVEYIGTFGICKEKYNLNIYIGKLFTVEQVANNIATELTLFLADK